MRSRQRIATATLIALGAALLVPVQRSGLERGYRVPDGGRSFYLEQGPGQLEPRSFNPPPTGFLGDRPATRPYRTPGQIPRNRTR